MAPLGYMSATFYIYKIINKINGKAYIGKKKCLYKKDSYFGSGELIKKAIRRYGKNNFIKIILEIVSEDNFREREIFWIAQQKTRYPAGYNLTDGGDGCTGRQMSILSKQKMSKTRTGRETKGTKPVSQFNKNGTFMKTFPSAHQACRETKVNAAQIGKVCNGNRTYAGGFIWKHAEKGT